MRSMGFSGAFLLAGVLGLAAAGGPIPVGSLVGSKNATLNGQAPLPYTTVLSGDNLQVRDGLALVTLDQGDRMILGSGTDASFSRETDGVAVSMTRGNLSLYHPEAGPGFRVKIGDVTVRPAPGYRTLGKIAMVDGTLRVTAKDGTLQVEKGGATKEVSKGKTITLAMTAARSPAPNPPVNLHMSHTAHVTGAVVAGGAAASLATMALTRSSTSVSPVVPAP